MKTTFTFLGLFALGAFSVGCSSSGDITDITVRAQRPTTGQQTGLVSGSLQNFTSPQGYRVSAAVGSWTEGLQQKTSQGYTVYTSVEGTIVSETADQTVVQ